MSILDIFAKKDDSESSDDTTEKPKAVREEVKVGAEPSDSKQALHEIATTRYLNYAMSVITSRALPDIRDGLKPVQRRILYSMYDDLKLTHDKRHRKSASVVGNTIAKFHPHGDSACYEAMVRMAQPWVMRLPLVDGHGNFGSVDGDNPAAHRYTEAKLQPVVSDLLLDLKKDVVPFVPNFDSTTAEPFVLPATLPVLLINGATGIAVGMATNIPPHNLGEIVDACVDLIRNPARKTDTLVKNFIQGPDFPTGGVMTQSLEDLITIYEEGTGSITIRSKWHTEKKGKKEYLVVTEIPYAVTKQSLIEKIAHHIVNNDLPQVEDIRDESTDDIRIVMELKAGSSVDAALAYLFKNTALESKFHVNLTCLVPDDQDPFRTTPLRLGLKDMLDYFIKFRMEVVQKRLQFDLKGLKERIHILEGFVKVLSDIQKAVDLVMTSTSKDHAKDLLIQTFGIDALQADHVLNTRIYRLANYEIQGVKDELQEKTTKASEIEGLLADENARRDVLIRELKSMKKLYGDSRRTSREENAKTFIYDESLYIEAADVVCVTSRAGWVRRQKSYSDVKTLRVRDTDSLGWVLPGNTRESILFFTNKGKVYTTRVENLPETTGYGDPVQSLFSFDDGEKIVSCFTLDPRVLKRDDILVAVTLKGQGIRFEVEKMVDPSTVSGRTYMKLDADDEVLGVDRVESPDDHAVLISRNGKSLSFPVEEINMVKGPGKGVKTLNLNRNDSILAFGLTSGTRGGAVSVDTSNGATHEIRHTTHGVGKRGQNGHAVLKRGSFVKWNLEVREVK
jgi:DNA gyrase subunit A